MELLGPDHVFTWSVGYRGLVQQVAVKDPARPEALFPYGDDQALGRAKVDGTADL